MDALAVSASGMNCARQTAASAADRIASSAKSFDSSTAGDMVTEGLIGLDVAAITYKANARVFQTASEMTSYLMDTLA